MPTVAFRLPTFRPHPLFNLFVPEQIELHADDIEYIHIKRRLIRQDNPVLVMGIGPVTIDQPLAVDNPRKPCLF